MLPRDCPFTPLINAFNCIGWVPAIRGSLAFNDLEITSKNPKRCATLHRQNAHLLRSFTSVSTAFASAASLYFGIFRVFFYQKLSTSL
jgi:hypothetical protein